MLTQPANEFYTLAASLPESYRVELGRGLFIDYYDPEMVPERS